MGLYQYFWAVVAGVVALGLLRFLPSGWPSFVCTLAAVIYLGAIAVWGNFNSRRVMSPWGHPPEDPPRKYDR